MAHPYHHAVSSARKFGGKAEDYQKIHDWFDETKRIVADHRHRMLRHHAEGIFLCEQIFGTTITNSLGQQVPVRLIGEQHVKEDFNGWIPTALDWINALNRQPWMGARQTNSEAFKIGRETCAPTARPKALRRVTKRFKEAVG
jgi:hypothetical protein